MSKVLFPLQSECERVLGHSGNRAGDGFDMAWYREHIVQVDCPWMLTDFKSHFAHIAIHKMFAPSLVGVLGEVWEATGKSQAIIDAHHYNVFSGSGCYRQMRSHNALSMHAFVAAIDWDAPENALHSQKHFFKTDDLLLSKFRAAGWTCGVDWRDNSTDAMHVQAPRVG